MQFFRIFFVYVLSACTLFFAACVVRDDGSDEERDNDYDGSPYVRYDASTGPDGDSDGDADADGDADVDTDADADADEDMDAACYDLHDGGFGLTGRWADAEWIREVYIGPSEPLDAGGDDPESIITTAYSDAGIRLLVEYADFDCVVHLQGGLDGFVIERDGGYDVLIQPADMCAYASACSCSQNVRLNIRTPIQGSNEVSVFFRLSTYFEPYPESEAVGTTIVEQSGTDCDNLQPCDAGACSYTHDCEGYFDYNRWCTSLPSCGGSFCAWDEEACFLECGGGFCTFTQTTPAQVECR